MAVNVYVLLLFGPNHAPANGRVSAALAQTAPFSTAFVMGCDGARCPAEGMPWLCVRRAFEGLFPHVFREGKVPWQHISRQDSLQMAR